MTISPTITNTIKATTSYGVKNTTSAILRLISKSKSEVDICGDYVMLYLVPREDEVFKKALSNARNRGVRLKCIIEITKENIAHCKKLMELVELRHLGQFKGNFMLNERIYLSITTTLQERQKTVPQIIHIDTKQIVEQYRYIFDALWNKATTISAGERIREIEEGDKSFSVDIIRDRTHAESLFLSQIQQSRSEVLVAIGSIQHLKFLVAIGFVDSIKQAKSRGVSIMILYSEEARSDAAIPSEIISDIKRYAQIKSISGIQGTILLIDNSKVLTMPEEDGFDSIAIYSDNKSLVKNFGSLLDSLWNETEMLKSIIVVKDNLASVNKQLMEANEQLKIRDQMQQDFINIAAHELRTPIMPILGYAELLEAEQGRGVLTTEEGEGQEENNNKRNYIRSIIKNAKRLEQLSELILDVTRIESKILNLTKERLNLNDLIFSVIDDLKLYTPKDQNKKDNNSIKLRYEPTKYDILIEADRRRLSQVISNLLDNAVKFTKEGDITIKTENKEGHILVSIKDTGSGVDPEIMPRLFTKFATKSDTGTGLGLFVSKSIVEAHGGRIWAENNKDGEKRGMTFTFSLPSSKQLDRND